MENPELYVVYPFALVDSRAPKSDYDRAVRTFRARAFPNTAGWSQCGIQAARLHLPETIDITVEHMLRHQKFPYGGWDNVGNSLAGSKLQVMDVPNFDTACVNLTALQEAMLQVITSPRLRRVTHSAADRFRSVVSLVMVSSCGSQASHWCESRHRRAMC